MGVSIGTYCPRCLVMGPEIGDHGSLGRPTLKGPGSFGAIFGALAAFKIVTPDLEAFEAFLQAHDGHGIRQWSDVAYSPQSEDADLLRRCKPFEHAPGTFVEASLELSCSSCGQSCLAQPARLRPFESFQPTPEDVRRFRIRALMEGGDQSHRAGFPFDDERELLSGFLDQHQRHPLEVRLSTEPNYRPMSAPRRQWACPDWRPEESEHWLGPAPLVALQDLHHVSADRRLTALAAIQDRGAVGYVVPLLQSPETGVRSAAAETLGRLGEPRAVRALGAALGDRAPEVRAAATKALAALAVSPDEALRQARLPRGPYGVASWPTAPEAATPRALETALRDPRPSLRLGAIEAIEASSEPWAFDLLLLAAVDPAWVMRSHAAKSLGRFGREPRSIDALLAMLEDGSSFVVSAAAEALGPLQRPEALDPLLRVLEDGRSSAVYFVQNAIAQLSDRRAYPALRRALAHPNNNVRSAAARILETLGSDDDVPALATLLSDRFSSVRQSALRALAVIKTPAAVAALASLRSRPDINDRLQAAHALSWAGNLDAADALVGFLEDKDGDVRSSAATAILKFGSPRQAAAARRALKAPVVNHPRNRKGNR